MRYKADSDVTRYKALLKHDKVARVAMKLHAKVLQLAVKYVKAKRAAAKWG